MKKLMAVLMVFSLIAGQLKADDIKGKVVSVIDGNTLEVVSLDNETLKLILVGIDCPELGQQFGTEAKQFMEKLMLDKDVVVTFHGKDRWGNQLAMVKIVNGSRDPKDPRIDLLKEGLAWTAEKNPDPDLDAHRTTAQQKGRGLWKDQNPIPPWTYRRQQTMAQAKSS
jgi:micrococcal nuclease